MPDIPCPVCNLVHRDLPCALTLDPTQIANAVLRRLVAEVQWDHGDGTAAPRKYDRVHNRHNRGPWVSREAPAAPRPPPREDTPDA